MTFYEVFSVTRATAGVANNVIPATFELNLNYRFAPHRTGADALARLAEITQAADAVEVQECVDGAPVPEGNPFLDRLVQIADAPVTPKQAWTDVARLARLRYPGGELRSGRDRPSPPSHRECSHRQPRPGLPYAPAFPDRRGLTSGNMLSVCGPSTWTVPEKPPLSAESCCMAKKCRASTFGQVTAGDARTEKWL